MKDIPKHILVTVIVIVVVTLVGGGAWYWSSGQLTAKLEEKSGLEGQIQAVEKKGIYPSSQNKKILEEQKAKLQALEDGVRPDLTAQMELFAPVRGIVPDGWKKAFDEKRQALRALAKEKNLALPAEYNFAFSSYVLAAPRAEHAKDLGVQLLTIEEIVKVVSDSGVDSLLSIKRAMIENARGSAGSTGGPGNEEAINNAKVVTGPESIYRVMPYEVSVKGDPDAIIRLVNGLGASKFFFVTRFIYLENEKSSVPKRSEITSAGAGTPEVKKTLIAVAGQEKVTARIRVDLIDFLPPVEPEVKKPTAPKK